MNVKKIFSAAAMLACIAVPAYGTTYNVTDATTMTNAMDNAVAGDIVHIAAGTYTVPPLPVNSGTLGNPITIIGVTTDSTAVKCTPWDASQAGWGMEGRDYITWRSIFFTDNVNINGKGGTDLAQGVRLTHCAVRGSVYLAGTDGGIDSSYIGLWVTGNNEAKIAFVNEGSGPFWNGVSPTGAYVTNCQGRLRVYTNTYGGATPMPLCWVSFPTSRRAALELVSGTVCTGNTFDIVKVGSADPTDNNGSIVAFYGASSNTVSNNTIAIYDSSSGTTKTMYAWYVRDNSYTNTFTGNTVTVNNGRFTYAFSVSGGGYGHTGNDYTTCWFTDHGTSTEVSFGSQGFISGETFSHCTFQSDSAQSAWLLNGNINGDLTFDHCTFFAPMTQYTFNVAPASWIGLLSLRNSIFYTRNTSTGNETALRVRDYVGPDKLDIDWNLYARYGASATVNRPYLEFAGGYYAMDNGINSPLCQFYNGSAPQHWDCNSQFGSPVFTDSTVTTFNNTGDVSGKANAHGQYGTDIGSHVVTTDTVRPDEIALTLAELSSTSVRLDWTSTGDDSLTGTCVVYDMRASTSVINAGNFDAAGTVANVPLPLVAGTAQSMIISGLAPTADYYFAIKARDEVPHWSAISNVVVRSGSLLGE